MAKKGALCVAHTVSFFFFFIVTKNVSFGRSSFSNSHSENNSNIDDNNTHNRESRNTSEHE